MRYLLIPIIFSWFLVFVTVFIVWYGTIDRDVWNSLSAAVTIAFFIGAIGGAMVLTPYLLRFTGVFLEYESRTATIQEPQVLVIQFYTSETEAEYIDCGLSDTEWRIMAETVHKTQKYTVDVLMSAFEFAGEVKQRGRDIYSSAGETLKVSGILKEVNRGYGLTDLGKYFFMRLATLPYPYETRPDIMKLLGTTVHTQATHIDNLPEVAD